MATLQKSFSTRVLTFGLFLICLVAATFAAALSVDQELAPPGASFPRRGSTKNTERSTDAEAQWVYMTIQNQASSGDISIKNADLKWGKWYEFPNKGQTLYNGDVEAERAGPGGGTMGVASCGKANHASGTEGKYDIYHGDTKVCHVHWDCPWGKKSNSFSITDQNENYVVQDTGGNFDSGALGSITIKVVKIS